MAEQENHNIKVSVITPCFNSEVTIRDTLESVACQTYKNVEHIIVDGNSKDNTLQIVKAFPHVFKIISESDNGIYDAMNKGIKNSTGNIISILNSDDFFDNRNVLQDVVNSFNSSGASIVYGNLYYVNETNTAKIVRRWKSSPYKQGAFIQGWHPPHPTLFVKKEVYDAYGLFDTALNISADFELMLRFIERYKVNNFYLDEFLVRMRMGGASNAGFKNILLGNINIKKAFKKNNIPYKRYYPVLRLMPKLFQFVIKQ
jgi:glycosyltransferase involved in cell wall biosynthesis